MFVGQLPTGHLSTGQLPAGQLPTSTIDHKNNWQPENSSPKKLSYRFCSPSNCDRLNNPNRIKFLAWKKFENEQVFNAEDADSLCCPQYRRCTSTVQYFCTSCTVFGMKISWSKSVVLVHGAPDLLTITINNFALKWKSRRYLRIKDLFIFVFKTLSTLSSVHFRNLVNSLLRRACDIASSYQLVHTEFMNIKWILSRNGYPNNFLDRCIQQFLNRKYGVTKQRDAPAEPSPSPKYISLQLPYWASISNNIRQQLSSFIRHKAVVNVKLRCFQSIVA